MPRRSCSARRASRARPSATSANVPVSIHALIARYYGSKADLYIAAVVAESQGDQPPSEFEGLEDMAQALVVPHGRARARTGDAGPHPLRHLG